MDIEDRETTEIKDEKTKPAKAIQAGAGLFSFRIFNALIVAVILAGYLYLSLSTPLSPGAIGLGIKTQLIRIIAVLGFSIPLFISFYLAIEAHRTMQLKIANLNDKSIKLRLESLSLGVLILTFVLLAGISLSQVRSSLFSDIFQIGYKVITILINYLYVFGYLIGFFLINKSSHFGKRFSDVTRNKWDTLATVLIVLFIGGFYTFIVFTNPNRTLPTLGAQGTYYLPDWLIFLTIVIPSVIGWSLGIRATLNLADINGLLSRLSGHYTSWYLIYAIFLIVTNAILLQLIISIGTLRLIDMGIQSVLFIIYLFVGIRFVSNLLFIKGINKLKFE